MLPNIEEQWNKKMKKHWLEVDAVDGKEGRVEKLSSEEDWGEKVNKVEKANSPVNDSPARTRGWGFQVDLSVLQWLFSTSFRGELCKREGRMLFFSLCLSQQRREKMVVVSCHELTGTNWRVVKVRGKKWERADEMREKWRRINCSVE